MVNNNNTVSTKATVNNVAGINITSKSGFYDTSTKVQDHIFSNVYLIGFILIISLVFIGYAIYYYINTLSTMVILANSSYYGTDISNYEPIFQDTTKTINDCIDTCKNDITCDGITYNSDTQICMGTKGGQVRNENANYSAWVKPEESKVNKDSTDFSKAVLIGYSKSRMTYEGNKMQNPYLIGYFSYSFNLTIYDFNKNFGSWRHIFHKGTEIPTGTILSYQSWENLIIDYPMQTIGVWMAPFTNNLRIAVTTTSLSNTSYGSYDNAFVEKCDSNGCYVTDMPNGKWMDKSRSGDGSIPKQKLDTYIEYIDHDLQNIPLNTQVNITVNFLGRDVEIYYNGKITKVSRLDGVPTINKLSLYAMNDKTIGGELSNLVYYPNVLKLGDIKSIMSLTPSTK